MTNPIRFKFDLDKFISCLGFFAFHKVKDLSKLKLCKLLYYVDKHHLIRHGRPVVGDVYYHLDNGPVPSQCLNIMNEVIENDKIYLKSDAVSNKAKVKDFLEVKRDLKEFKYPVFVSKKQPDMECLSDSDIKSLESVLEEYGRFSAGKLVALTHEEAPWKNSSSNSEIDYRLFFKDDPDAKKEAFEYMELIQEDNELVFSLG